MINATNINNQKSKLRRIDYTGQHIGYIDVLKYIEINNNGKEIREYECYCNACNSYVVIPHNSLRIAKSHMVAEGKNPSCGCMQSYGIRLWNNKNKKRLNRINVWLFICNMCR